ncbi:hypothetical protein HBI09_236630 [Parastagonospora nodorum]|nr:hypothetical protein HBI09_236630 [Parastagonospora nodorum]KAH4968503.1 hypothetical protein HBI77_242860 [Parastagonospora nodorum]
MLQTNIREGYRIITLEIIKLIEDLISYLRNAQIPKVFYKAASLSVVSNRSTALITNKFSIASLTKLAILNNANITLVDAVHYSVVIDALTMTLIKDDNNLLGTINSHIKPPLKRYKTKAADSRYAKASRERTKKDKDLEDSNTSSNLGKEAQLKKTKDEEELAKAKKEKEKKELTDAYILYFKELSSNNSRIFANAIGIGKTQAIVLAIEVQNAQAESNAIEHNAVNNNDKLYPTKGKRTFYYANSPLENISRLIKEEAIEMRINTTNAIFKALAAANKLIILEANTPTMHSKATKHYLALLAAQFIIVCSFRKVDKHIFRAYNTISFNATNKRDSVTSDRIYKIEDARNIIANIKHDASEHESSYKDILEKESFNKLEASRRIIFNRFKMQAIAFYPTLTTLKAAQFKTYSSRKVKRFTLNSVKDLFTNLSKNYFLVREARAITKSSLKFQNLSNLCSESIAAEDAAKAANILLLLKKVCAKILIESYKLIVQAIIVALIAFTEAIILIEATHVVIIELQDSIVYFNLDSKLELKVLSKQDVKTTS